MLLLWFCGVWGAYMSTHRIWSLVARLRRGLWEWPAILLYQEWFSGMWDVPKVPGKPGWLAFPPLCHPLKAVTSPIQHLMGEPCLISLWESSLEFSSLCPQTHTIGVTCSCAVMVDLHKMTCHFGSHGRWGHLCTVKWSASTVLGGVVCNSIEPMRIFGPCNTGNLGETGAPTQAGSLSDSVFWYLFLSWCKISACKKFWFVGGANWFLFLYLIPVGSECILRGK